MNKREAKKINRTDEAIINGKRVLDKYVILNFNRIKAVQAIFPDKSDIASAQYFLRMMDKPELVAYLEEKQRRALRKNELDIDELVNFLAAVIRVDPLECYETDGSLKPLDKMTDAARMSIQSIKQRDIVSKDKRKREQVELEIRFYDKLVAVEKMFKHLGAYEADNVQRRKEGGVTFNKPQILVQSSLPSGKEETKDDLRLELISKLKKENLLSGE